MGSLGCESPLGKTGPKGAVLQYTASFDPKNGLPEDFDVDDATDNYDDG